MRIRQFHLPVFSEWSTAAGSPTTAKKHVGVRPTSMAAALKDSIEKGISRSAQDRCENGLSVKVGKVADMEHWTAACVCRLLQPVIPAWIGSPPKSAIRMV